MPDIEDDGFVTVHHSNHVATQGTRRELIEKGILPADQRAAGDVLLSDLVSQGLLSDGSIERLAFEAESFIVVLDGEHRNVGCTIRAYATEVARLVKERRHIIEERDRTFALVLARAEAAEARAKRLESKIEEAYFAGWSDGNNSTSVTGDPSQDWNEFSATLTTENANG